MLSPASSLPLTLLIIGIPKMMTSTVSAPIEPAMTPTEGTAQMDVTSVRPPEGTSEEVPEWTGGRREGESVYSVVAEDGRVCVRAQLEAVFSVRYFTVGLTTTRLLTREFILPEDATPRGDCNETSARLSLVWDEGNSSMIFYIQHNATEVPPSWSITRVQFIFQTGSGTEYPEIIQGGLHIVESYLGARLLTAPDNTSFKCDVEQDIELYETTPPDMASTLNTSAIEAVTLGLFNVRVQAGPLPPVGFSETEMRCDADLLIHDEGVRVVTVTIASCLAAAIFLILIGYCIIRTRSAPTPYASMQ